MSTHQPPQHGSPQRQPQDPGPYGQLPGGPQPYGPVDISGMPPLATAGQRILARLIDAVPLAVIWVLALAATGALEYAAEHDGQPDPGKAVASAIATFALYFVYEGAMLSRSGQTLGKRALRIRVAVLANGDVPGGSGWTRAAVYVLPGMLSWAVIGWVFWLIDSLWFLWDQPFRQCLHDKAAKTVVVEAR